MSKTMFEEVSTDSVYKIQAPFSMATIIDTGNVIFVSGQVAQDISGTTVGIGDFGAQARQVFLNIYEILASRGADLSNICKLTVFLTDRSYFPEFAAVRRELLRAPYPATSAVVVAGLAQPDWLVEVEAVAVI